MKAKEAYVILSDPKKRRLYDKLGSTGMKLIESPQEINPLELLRNFQRNKEDRITIGVLVGIVFVMILVLPILFSLKCDQSLGSSVPWLAIWIPMWIVDTVFLVGAAGVFLLKKRHTNEEGEVIDEGVPLSVKTINLVRTILFILLQVFILIKLDHKVDWSWYNTFFPWFAYESLLIAGAIPSALETISSPDLDNFVATPAVDSEAGLADELLHQRILLQNAHFEKCVKQHSERKSVCMSLIRIWQGIFLALQLDHTVDWEWSLVLLPVWTYLGLQFMFALSLRSWSREMSQGVGGDKDDPEVAAKMQRAQGLSSAYHLSCCMQLVPLFMSVLLLSKLQSSHISTFVIILPLFICICLCCCFVSCVLSLASTIDVDSLEEQGVNPAAAQGREMGGFGSGVEAARGSNGGADASTPLLRPLR